MCDRCGHEAPVSIPPGECPDCGGMIWRFDEPGAEE